MTIVKLSSIIHWGFIRQSLCVHSLAETYTSVFSWNTEDG